MRHRVAAAKPVVLTVVMAMSVWCGSARADALRIQRCVSAEGEVAYSDRNCSGAGTRVTPLSGELVMRITRDLARSPAESDALGRQFSTLEQSAWTSPSSMMPVRRPAVDGCARSPYQLSLDLVGAMAMHDVNRVAESFHWVGMSHRQGQRIMDRLQQLTRQPVRHAEYFDAWIDDGLSGEGSAHSAGIVQLLLGDDAMRIVDLDVKRYSGCYFVRFQPA
jgi:hypothetical protein